MSTINNITTSVVSAFQGVTPVTETAPVDAPTNTAPAFQETLTTQGRAFALGLGAPRNHGDIEAIFAEIATKFGVEVSKANDFANAAQTAVRNTALTAAAGFLAFFSTFNQIMVSSELNIKRQNQVISEKTTQINQLEAEKAPLVQQRDALVNEYNANAGRFWQNIGTMNSLQAQINTLTPLQTTACGTGGNAATCQSLTSQINTLQGQISSLQTENNNLVNRNNHIAANLLPPLNSQINALQAQIDTATSERNAAINSRNQSENAYNLALGQINLLSVVVIPFTVALALGQVGAGARASFGTGEGKDGVDDAVAQAVNRLAELSEDMGTLSQLRQTLFQIPATTPDMTTPPTGVEMQSDSTEVQPEVGQTPVTPPVIDQPPPEEPQVDAIPGMQPLPPMPVLETPVMDGVTPDPQIGGVDATQRPSGMEILRQILANLPVRTDNLLPDPVFGTTTPPQGGQPVTPQNAFDVVRQLLQDMLPPGVGNAEEVAQRAGDLATALTLLRGALSQVAQSEASQTPQVPGTSGRLNLAI